MIKADQAEGLAAPKTMTRVDGRKTLWAARGAALAVLFVMLALTCCGAPTAQEQIQQTTEQADSADLEGSASDGSQSDDSDERAAVADDEAAGEAATLSGTTGVSASSGGNPDANDNTTVDLSAEIGSEPEGGGTASAHEDGTAVVETAIAVEELLAGLIVAEEVRGGYERDLFKHWIDDDRDGCNTRFEVLIAESLVDVSVGPSCKLSGAWLSLYDGVTTDDSGDFDVDHMVPLQEAWQSGAHGWSAELRARYANDLEHPQALIAVSASSNRSKGAKDPAEWLPPDASVHCGYAWDWVLVKTLWSLTVDQAELDALTRILSGCAPGGLSGAQSAIAPTPAAPATTAGTPVTTSQPPTTTSAAVPATTEAGTVPSNPGDSRNCSDFASHDEAQAWFDRYFPHYGDVARLDRNGDGQACESLR